MSKSRGFYERVILSAFYRRSAEVLPLSIIKADGVLALNYAEVEADLMPVFEEMVAEGYFELIDPKKELYRRLRK